MGLERANDHLRVRFHPAGLTQLFQNQLPSVENVTEPPGNIS